RFCPPTASKTTTPILLAVGRETFSVPPRFILPVKPRSATAWPLNGTKKSLALVAFPFAVETEIRPDPTAFGTVTFSVVDVAELTDAPDRLKWTRLFPGEGS